MQNKKGFTLLELLVVVVIIGILAAIALPQYQMAVGKSKFATLKDNARVIKNALDRYYLVNNDFTTNLNDLDVTVKNSSDYVCYIGGSAVFCNRKIFGVTMEYSITYRGDNINKKACIAFSQNLTDKPNRLCQQETSKTTGDQAGTWTTYFY